jgi:hypothetical protein
VRQFLAGFAGERKRKRGVDFFFELRCVVIDSEEDRPVRREERLFGGIVT